MGKRIRVPGEILKRKGGAHGVTPLQVEVSPLQISSVGGSVWCPEWCQECCSFR